MAIPAVGEVVLVAFPHADFSRFKRRPAIVVGRAEFNNLILCQVTSQAFTSKSAIALEVGNFSKGGLLTNSFVRPDKLFTVEPSVILKSLGTLDDEKMATILSTIKKLFI